MSDMNYPIELIQPMPPPSQVAVIEREAALRAQEPAGGVDAAPVSAESAPLPEGLANNVDYSV